MFKKTISPTNRRISLAMLSAFFIVSASLIVAYTVFTPSGLTLAVGQVAPNDILAPHNITYDSTVLTQLARQSAADSISAIYDPPNPSISRQQIQLARHILDYINDVRHDTYASLDQQVADLSAVTALNLDQDTLRQLLKIPDDAWSQIDDQVMSIVQRMMQDPIREDQLDQIHATIPNLISINIDDPEDQLITALAQDLIKPNAFYNDQRTRQARDAASKAVTPETRTFIEGQIVVRAGTVVTDADMEALAQLKLLQPPDHRIDLLLSALIAVTLMGTLGMVYLRRFHIDLYYNIPMVALVGGLVLIFLAGARVFGSVNEFQSHLYPAAAFALIAVAIAGPEVALMSAGALAALIGLMNNSSLDLTALIAVGSMAGVLSLRRVERLNAYFVAGLIIGAVNVTVSLIFVLGQGSTDAMRVLSLISAGLLNGIMSAGLAVVGLYLISSVLNLPTSVKLIELSQPNQPLLQRLIREAPGTYQHSLQVANLAEMAAERIGANAAMTRVAALYHDIGKIVNAHFFIENQINGMNPHDALNDPLRSAQIIIGHVSIGEKLARQNHLPNALIDFILQHHGTMSVLYFYNQALKAVDCDESKINKAAFAYPGPKPQNRESAILMLADASESTVRSKRPATKQAINDIVQHVIEERLSSGQLDDSHLSITELKIIQEVFVTNLQGVFHPRIVYPAAPTPVATHEVLKS